MAPQKKEWVSNFFSRVADAAAIGAFLFLWNMNMRMVAIEANDKSQQATIDETKKQSEDNHDKMIHFEAMLPDGIKKSTRVQSPF